MAAGTIRVLHVDDEPDLVNLSQTVIEREHEEISIEAETDPRACLDRLERDPSAIDCIVSDYNMPHLTGLEMLEIVREEYSDFPFILFTGRGSEEIAAEAISRGVDDYMQKEMGLDQYTVLANRIKQLVQQVRTERALHNSEAKYRALVEQNVVGIYIIRDDEFTYVNPQFAEIFGYDRDDLLGRAPRDLVADVDKDRVEENLRRRFEGEIETIQYAFTGQHASGDELDIVVQGRVITLNGESAVAGVLLDRGELVAAGQQDQ